MDVPITFQIKSSLEELNSKIVGRPFSSSLSLKIRFKNRCYRVWQLVSKWTWLQIYKSTLVFARHAVAALIDLKIQLFSWSLRMRLNKVNFDPRSSVMQKNNDNPSKNIEENIKKVTFWVDEGHTLLIEKISFEKLKTAARSGARH